MIRYGAQSARPIQGLGASGLRGPEPKCRSLYISMLKNKWLPSAEVHISKN